MWNDTPEVPVMFFLQMIMSHRLACRRCTPGSSELFMFTMLVSRADLNHLRTCVLDKRLETPLRAALRVGEDQVSHN